MPSRFAIAIGSAANVLKRASCPLATAACWLARSGINLTLLPRFISGVRDDELIAEKNSEFASLIIWLGRAVVLPFAKFGRIALPDALRTFSTPFPTRGSRAAVAIFSATKPPIGAASPFAISPMPGILGSSGLIC